MKDRVKFAFFGTPEFAVVILDELKKAGFSPELVVTARDKRAGRGMELTFPPVKTWAEENNVDLIQPEKLDNNFLGVLRETGCELFLLAAYGKILPKEILAMPKHGILNVHPSLLPKFRGASPVESAILSGEEETGVSLMLLDEKMDHGPILRSEKVKIENGEKAPDLEKRLAYLGGKLLAEAIPEWVAGKIKAKEQEHVNATFTKKITKENGLLDLDNPAEENYRKFRAYFGWPGTYFFTDRKNKKIRVLVKDAVVEGGNFVIKRVLPEGGREMDYSAFLSA